MTKKKKTKTKKEKSFEELVGQLTIKDLAMANRHINHFKKYHIKSENVIDEEVMRMEIEMYLKDNNTLTVFTAMCIKKAIETKNGKYKHKSRSTESVIRLRNRPKPRSLYIN